MSGRGMSERGRWVGRAEKKNKGMVGTSKSKKNRSRMRRGGECERKMKREDGRRVVGRGKGRKRGGNS